MANILWLDLETYSEIPIKHGIHAYAEHVEIMLFAWAIDGDPVQVWDVTANAKIPLELRLALQNPDVLIYAHNSHFDRTVLNHAMPGVAAGGVERWRDTMVRALAHGLPGSLGDLCDILNVSQDKAKNKAGKQLIQLFCKPRPKNSATRRTTAKTIDIWAVDNNFGKRINASLGGVQFYRDGDAFAGSGMATENDFDDVNEGEDADSLI